MGTAGSASSREEAGSQAGSRTRGQGAMTITRGGVPAQSSDSNFDASVFPVGTSEQPSESPTNSGWLATPFCRPQRTPSAHGERGLPHTCPGLQSPLLPHAACHRRASDLIQSIAVRLIGDTPRPTSVWGTLPTVLFSAPQNRYGPRAPFHLLRFWCSYRKDHHHGADKHFLMLSRETGAHRGQLLKELQWQLILVWHLSETSARHPRGTEAPGTCLPSRGRGPFLSSHLSEAPAAARCQRH